MIYETGHARAYLEQALRRQKVLSNQWVVEDSAEVAQHAAVAAEHDLRGRAAGGQGAAAQTRAALGHLWRVAWRCMARHGTAWHGTAWHDPASEQYWECYAGHAGHALSTERR
eukprot:365643-Chlamydomonas_euryale.AAC.2